MVESHLLVQRYQIPQHPYRDTSPQARQLLVNDCSVACHIRASELELLILLYVLTLRLHGIHPTLPEQSDPVKDLAR